MATKRRGPLDLDRSLLLSVAPRPLILDIYLVLKRNCLGSLRGIEARVRRHASVRFPPPNSMGLVERPDALFRTEALPPVVTKKMRRQIAVCRDEFID